MVWVEYNVCITIRLLIKSFKSLKWHLSYSLKKTVAIINKILKFRIYEYENHVLLSRFNCWTQDASCFTVRSILSVCAMEVGFQTICDVKKSCSYACVLKSDLHWAHRTFTPLKSTLKTRKRTNDPKSHFFIIINLKNNTSNCIKKSFIKLPATWKSWWWTVFHRHSRFWHCYHEHFNMRTSVFQVPFPAQQGTSFHESGPAAIFFMSIADL